MNAFRQKAEELRSVSETQPLDMIISNLIATLPSSFGVFDTMWH